MPDILSELYADIFSKDLKSSPTYKTIFSQTEDLWARAGRYLPEDLIDALRSSHCDLEYENGMDCFRHGFRLGAALMLELTQA